MEIESLFLIFFNVVDDIAGITRRKNIGRDVFGYDAACTDICTVADGQTRANDC